MGKKIGMRVCLFPSVWTLDELPCHITCLPIPAGLLRDTKRTTVLYAYPFNEVYIILFVEEDFQFNFPFSVFSLIKSFLVTFQVRNNSLL